ncbi:hypothetical protein NP233_g3601 [Leucocoprinus birnbaumii]|uniref:Uncharacterized protein n=1 Tax=Leucocoprinus birnbaumii TaxID=56174 RepID=A0AAD5VW95_9AGAR|nr:hypothetical protein NP233_g3601 [Leucocoprinus birnbaumii]
MSDCKLFLGFYPTGGALLFGVVLDLLLFGVLTVQIYIHHISFPNDTRLLKSAVALVYLIGIVQTAVALRDLYNFSSVVRCPGMRLQRWPQNQTWFSIDTSGAIVALNVQWCYAYRIYLLSKKPWISAIVVLLSLGQLASGIIGALCGSGLKRITGKLFDEGICLRAFDHVGMGPSECNLRYDNHDLYDHSPLQGTEKNTEENDLYTHDEDHAADH